MFLGHLAVGFAAKQVAPRTNLGVLLLASEFIDVLFPIFVLIGWENVWEQAGANPFTRSSYFYPLSHSLVMTLLWAALASWAYWAFRRDRRAATVVGLVVLSHWLLDLVSHKPDMPLYPGDSPMLGLGLWYSVPGTIIVESLMLAAGVWLYVRATSARNWKGVAGLWVFVGIMAALYAAAILGPPAPNAKAIAWVGVLFNLFYLLAWWIDRNRAPSAAP